MRSTIALLTLLAIFQVACASAPPPLRGPTPLEWRALVGCYQLAATGAYPWRFVLDSVPATRRFSGTTGEAWQSRNLGASAPAEYEFWQITPRNTVTVVEHQFPGGRWLEMVVRGDTLAGRLQTYSHHGRNAPPPLPARAVRTPCPAEPARPSGE